MSRTDDMRQYLLSLNAPSEDKRYTIYFCKKMEYLNSLKDIMVQETKEYVSMGYGNVNSKICLAVKNEKVFNTIKPLIQNVLDKFGINFWDVYITFIDKTQSPYDKKYELFINEINAIKPKLLYIFDKDDTGFKEIENHSMKLNIPMPERSFFVDAEKLVSEDVKVKQELWNVFRYFINYKDIN